MLGRIVYAALDAYVGAVNVVLYAAEVVAEKVGWIE